MFRTPQLFISSIFSWRGTRLRSEGRRLSKTENHQCCGLRWPWVSTSNNGILTKNNYIPNHIHIISYYIILYQIISYYIILYQINYIILYHIIAYYITLYHIIAYYIILYHIISYYIILYHIISDYIVLYHIISYYIILYHIVCLYIYTCMCYKLLFLPTNMEFLLAKYRF